MKITFLGTNGWYDTNTGNTICTLIQTENYNIIFDAGNGIYKIDKYIANNKPIYLFLSHFHLDHIAGLHILLKFKFKQGIGIYGQIGTKNILNKIICPPFTCPLNELKYKIDVFELDEGQHKIPFFVECKYLLHRSKCMGYRVHIDNKIIAHCLDTGICKNAIELSKNADLVLTECSKYNKEALDASWPHLNPEMAAKIAIRAGAKKLALTHFDASVYKTIDKREQAQKIFKNTIVAIDDRKIEI
ncbi:MAG: MBL fold metallo-hydrolase [Candidatus Aenigmarchaeota archaeon ex4484_52]|nr:MAG: MBL fold metallo-hydrolase [Candidatus Aenigmarchaeota archaeon ex4484_52]